MDIPTGALVGRGRGLVVEGRGELRSSAYKNVFLGAKLFLGDDYYLEGGGVLPPQNYFCSLDL